MMEEWYHGRVSLSEPLAQPVSQSGSLQAGNSAIIRELSKVKCNLSPTNLTFKSTTTGGSLGQQMAIQCHKERMVHSNRLDVRHNNTSPTIVEQPSFSGNPTSYNTLQQPKCQGAYHESHQHPTMMAATNDPQQHRSVNDYSKQQPNQLDSWIGHRSLRITAGSAMGTAEIFRDHSPSIVTICGSATSNDDTKSMSPTANNVVSAVLSSEVAIVTPSDVLFGRGKFQRAHDGNKTMRGLVHSMRSLYEGCLDRDDKTSITRHIVKTIQQRGGRFLKYDNDRRGWRVVSDEEARQKISHVMRDDPARKHKLASTHVAVSTSSMQPISQLQQHEGAMLSPAKLKLSEEDADFLIDIFSTTTKG